MARKAPQVISVINQKGGTGKTTTTINLGSALQHLGKRVLLVDLDPQANLTYSLGLAGADPNLAKVFTESSSFESAVYERAGLFILPGSNDLVDVELAMISEAKREEFLKKILQKARDFDFVLIDCPPSLSVLTVNALTASNEVLIPLQMEVLTLQGLGQILTTIDKIRKAFNSALRVKGIVIVQYDTRRKLSHEVEQYLQENVNERVFETKIRMNVKLAESPSFGQSVIDYAPGSTGAQDYISLANEFLAN
jgi:chromosome partitioning protein